MSAGYGKPNTSPDYRVTQQECLDRAQRGLEVAEMNLDAVAEEINQLNQVLPADLIAHADARTRVAMGWTDLAMQIGWES